MCDVPGEAAALMDALWPGDLSLRLNWKSTSAAAKYAGTGRAYALVGCPDDALGHLAKETGSPVAATSANISPQNGDYGRGPAITIEEVRQFVSETGVRIEVLLDGGICPQAHHMTVVDCTRPGQPEIVRDGTTHPRALAAALGESPLQADRSGTQWRSPA